VLIADAAKARRRLDWEPKVTFKELVRIMVNADMEALGLTSLGAGKAAPARHGLNTIDRALINPTGGVES
jgi:GDPmannose 4,6-dehydratase